MMTSKTISELAIENRELSRRRNEVDISTKYGKNKLKKINEDIEKNNAIIREMYNTVRNWQINMHNWSLIIKPIYCSIISWLKK